MVDGDWTAIGSLTYFWAAIRYVERNPVRAQGRELSGVERPRPALARSYAEAPEIDGLIRVENRGDLAPGSVYDVIVTRADAHDLWARPVADAC